MKVTLIIQQIFDIEADTLLQVYYRLREGYFPTSENLLAVRDELSQDITEMWHELTEETQN